MNLINRGKRKYKGSMAGSSLMPSRSNKEPSVTGRVTEETMKRWLPVNQEVGFHQTTNLLSP